MHEFVWVDDGPQHLYTSVDDVDCHRIDQCAAWVEHRDSRLSVDLDLARGDSRVPHLPAEPYQQAGYAIPADDRCWPRRGLSSSVAVRDSVSREQPYQAPDVPPGAIDTLAQARVVFLGTDPRA
jgi:hypothetical protein